MSTTISAEEPLHYSEIVRRYGEQYRTHIIIVTYSFVNFVEIPAVTVQLGLLKQHKIGDSPKKWGGWLKSISPELSQLYNSLSQLDCWDENFNILTQQGMECALKAYVRNKLLNKDI